MFFYKKKNISQPRWELDSTRSLCRGKSILFLTSFFSLFVKDTETKVFFPLIWYFVVAGCRQAGSSPQSIHVSKRRKVKHTKQKVQRLFSFLSCLFVTHTRHIPDSVAKIQLKRILKRNIRILSAVQKETNHVFDFLFFLNDINHDLFLLIYFSCCSFGY